MTKEEKTKLFDMLFGIPKDASNSLEVAFRFVYPAMKKRGWGLVELADEGCWWKAVFQTSILNKVIRFISVSKDPAEAICKAALAALEGGAE